MNVFSGNKSRKDERIIQLQNKIYRELYWVVVVICFFSIAVKMSIYGWGEAMILTELAILLACGVYYLIRSSYLGLFSDEIETYDERSKFSTDTKIVFFIGTVGVAIALFMGINSAVQYAEGTAQSWAYFGSVFLVSIVMYLGFLSFVIGIPYLLAKSNSRQEKRGRVNEEYKNEGCESGKGFVPSRTSKTRWGLEADDWLNRIGEV